MFITGCKINKISPASKPPVLQNKCNLHKHKEKQRHRKYSIVKYLLYQQHKFWLTFLTSSFKNQLRKSMCSNFPKVIENTANELKKLNSHVPQHWVKQGARGPGSLHLLWNTSHTYAGQCFLLSGFPPPLVALPTDRNECKWQSSSKN